MGETDAAALGAYLTGSEAKGLADRLGGSRTLSEALRSLGAARRGRARELIMSGGLGDHRERLVAVLRAIEGARSVVTRIDPCWTLPGDLARSGMLTSSVAHLICGATASVTCSTFNFQRTSRLWDALGTVAARPEVRVRVYVDAHAAASGRGTTPTTDEVADHLHPAAVFRTAEQNGRRVRNHAKFVAVDHRFALITSANLSRSAEFDNIELGVILDHPGLTELVEQQLRDIESSVFERVRPHQS